MSQCSGEGGHRLSSTSGPPRGRFPSCRQEYWDWWHSFTQAVPSSLAFCLICGLALDEWGSQLTRVGKDWVQPSADSESAPAQLSQRIEFLCVRLYATQLWCVQLLICAGIALKRGGPPAFCATMRDGCARTTGPSPCALHLLIQSNCFPSLLLVGRWFCIAVCHRVFAR